MPPFVYKSLHSLLRGINANVPLLIPECIGMMFMIIINRFIITMMWLTICITLWFIKKHLSKVQSSRYQDFYLLKEKTGGETVIVQNWNCIQFSPPSFSFLLIIQMTEDSNFFFLSFCLAGENTSTFEYLKPNCPFIEGEGGLFQELKRFCFYFVQ